MNGTQGALLLGTSGYDYPEWKGAFYPAGLRRRDFLAYYAGAFNALEVNSTFYAMPTAGRLASFDARAEGRLRFSVKVNRLLTHAPGADWRAAAAAFAAALEPLQAGGRLAAALFQFPQGFRYSRENRLYLAALLGEFRGFPAVVEFRHREWLRESVFAGLAARGAALARCDMPPLAALPGGGAAAPLAGPMAYLRLHGRNAAAWYAHGPEGNGAARYDYCYSDAELMEFVPVLRAALAQGTTVQVYFNNHPNGSGARNALRLREMVEAG